MFFLLSGKTTGFVSVVFLFRPYIFSLSLAQCVIIYNIFLMQMKKDDIMITIKNERGRRYADSDCRG